MWRNQDWKLFSRPKMLMELGGFVLLSVLVCLLLIMPRLSQVGKLQKELVSLRELVSSTRQGMKQLKDIDSILLARKDELENLKAKTIKPGESPRIIQMLTELSSRLNMQIDYIAPEEREEVTTQVESIQKSFIKLQASCRFRTLSLFLEALDDLPAKLTVEEMTVSKEEEIAPLLRIHLLLAAYYLYE